MEELYVSQRMRVKIVSSEEVHRRNKRKLSICFTSGCFDLFHPGHVHFLHQCRRLITKDSLLVVGLNSDESVVKWKQREPIYSQGDRAYMITMHPEVDYVILFNERNPKLLINSLKPTMILHGDSIDRPAWTSNSLIELASYHGEVVRIPIKGWWSTSEVIRKAAGRYAQLKVT